MTSTNQNRNTYRNGNNQNWIQFRDTESFNNQEAMILKNAHTRYQNPAMMSDVDDRILCSGQPSDVDYRITPQECSSSTSGDRNLNSKKD